MQNEIGAIIDGREPDTLSVADGVSKPTERASGPEIINGFESSEPDTERITGTDTGTGRLTKSGRVDRRTKRGRGIGTDTDTGTESEKSVHISKLDLAEVLFTVHLTLSEFTKIEELAIEKSEAKDLGDAIREYSKFYGVSFDPKKVALFNLCLAMGRVYVPRAVALKARMSKQKTSAGPQLVDKDKPGSRQGAVHVPPVKVDLSQVSPSALWGETAEL